VRRSGEACFTMAASDSTTNIHRIQCWFVLVDAALVAAYRYLRLSWHQTPSGCHRKCKKLYSLLNSGKLATTPGISIRVVPKVNWAKT
jgi:hypothetical protein